jgi:transcriptional regulator with XRE-family HTH domain
MTSMISDDIQKRLAENVKRIRKSKKLTQFQLAERADVSEETIKNIELCRCWTSDKNLAKITDALNVDIYKLFLPVESSIQEDSKNIAQIKQTIAEELKSYIETKLNEIIR